jgi:hypothetical protein
MSKKVIIVAAVIVVLIAIFLVALNFFRTKNFVVGPSGEQSQTINSPLLSAGILKENTNPAPIVNPFDYKIVIEDSKDSTEIKKEYKRYIENETDQGLQWAIVLTNSNQVVALEDFAKGINLQINSRIKELLMPYRYYLFSCNTDGKVSHGLVLRNKVLPDYPGDLDHDEEKFIKDWERTMLRDTQSIVFPGLSFTEDQLNQPLMFKKGKYKYAEFILPGGQGASLNYALVDSNYIVISDSPVCMDDAIYQLDTPAP